jgi:hypothetical protein
MCWALAWPGAWSSGQEKISKHSRIRKESRGRRRGVTIGRIRIANSETIGFITHRHRLREFCVGPTKALCSMIPAATSRAGLCTRAEKGTPRRAKAR